MGPSRYRLRVGRSDLGRELVRGSVIGDQGPSVLTTRVRLTGRMGGLVLRWRGVALSVCVAAGVGGMVVARTLEGRAMSRVRHAAIESVARAERAGVAQADPGAARDVRTLLERAYAGERAWRSRPWPGGGGATALYEETRQRAESARRARESAVRQSLDSSGAVVLEAAAVLDSPGPRGYAGPSPATERALYKRARLALYEAEAYYARHDHASASARARRAIDLAAMVRERLAGRLARFEDDTLVARWRAWHREAVAWSRAQDALAIVVDKAHHRLLAYGGGRLMAAMAVDLGFSWVADKRHANDGASPEGRYRVVARRGAGASQYHKALLLDYPNADDRDEFTRLSRRGEVPAGVGIGGLIEIHGEGGGEPIGPTAASPSATPTWTRCSSVRGSERLSWWSARSAMRSRSRVRACHARRQRLVLPPGSSSCGRGLFA